MEETLHTGIGAVGHLSVIIAFVTALLSTFSYYKATVGSSLEKKNEWLTNARVFFYTHIVSVMTIVVALFSIIYNHYFEYHYAYSHSSRNLPTHYMISCFWEGQEGSFILWLFWNAWLGLALIFTNKKWEAPVMTVFGAVQAFIASMILGVMIFDLKIGSSPFILLRDAMVAPIFETDPNFVPEDGTGLNPLLQNIWMVIHPPTLFLGYAAGLIPFAYCIAGLWQNKFKEWIRPALPWMIFATAILGLGIIMGAYWAYETLNFGGYWNWDPVENAVYIPWLIMVGAIHTMIVFKKSETALKTSIILVLSSFILILYSTFLTRSGVLGNASVHSFTDLGLSGQLLLYMMFFVIVSVALCIVKWKKIPTSDYEVSNYSREFWIFIGVTTLSLMSFQVLIPTSIPVWNAFLGFFGIESNLAAPADQIGFYTKYQLWFSIAVAILSGTGQFFYWKKMTKDQLVKDLAIPIVISLLISAIIIVSTVMNNMSYILLVTASVYSIVSNSKVLFSILKNSSIKLSGGSISHIGIAMMLIGILFSSGYSEVISLNNTGMLIFDDAPDDTMNKENVLLWINKPRKMGEYTLRYRGTFAEIEGAPGYVLKSDLDLTDDPFKVIAKKDIKFNKKTYFKKGDTLRTHPENTYYQVEYEGEDGEQFKLYPRAQINPSMGLLASPDIKTYATKDIYTHVSSVTDPNQEKEWSDEKEIESKIKDRFFLNDFVTVFDEMERLQFVDGVPLSQEDVAVKAKLRIFDNDRVYRAEPIFIIKDRQIGKVPAYIDDLGVRITLNKINPESGIMTFGLKTTMKDYIVMKAMSKPLINVLWIGTLVLMLGFIIAMYRRFQEYNKLEKS
ncbi:cytochrome c biogenesis protein CcsA [Aureibacter tunicatorum]|uniref:Cytochrome c-type biogenesis protein CcmF n=1 Tax=Aureibacter tunicatorum TaxID=866807 RepID=A0AAE3XQC5_9BACT|nr:cytochrome c biogenesis protein CcsA [Aureibacter tunicatorum]MDR6240143.1 cytochrome c-type biogenesis protein CcmF [Aureibacter tunicatorum]BDD05976.1 cytochrome c assembly protein [Aureibacter tunicatorum]